MRIETYATRIDGQEPGAPFVIVSSNGTLSPHPNGAGWVYRPPARLMPPEQLVDIDTAEVFERLSRVGHFVFAA